MHENTPSSAPAPSFLLPWTFLASPSLFFLHPAFLTHHQLEMVHATNENNDWNHSALQTHDALAGYTQGQEQSCSVLAETSIDRMEETLCDMERRYPAYVRHDTYGRMGMEDISLWEKLRLVFCLIFLVPVKIVLLFTLVIAYYIICICCTLFKSADQNDVEVKPEDEKAGNEGDDESDANGRSEVYQENYAHLTGCRRAVIVLAGRCFSRLILFVLGFYWMSVTQRVKESAQQTKEGEVAEEMQPGAIVSNHVSYIDILYHMSASFPSFVAKRSVARLPLIGLISKCLGCVYVQREGKASDIKGVAEIIRRRLQAAASSRNVPLMMLFPEGTTTNGFYILPFKTGAFLAGVPVQPVILKYPYRRFSPAWDTISGVRHVILLLCQFVNHLEILWLPLYVPSNEEKADPKLYANNVRKLMAVEGGLLLSEVGLQEKRIYHTRLNEYLSLKL